MRTRCSSDGTSEAVCEAFPQASILRGQGSLFWNGGMRVAFEAAMQRDRAFRNCLTKGEKQAFEAALDKLAGQARAFIREEKR
jgi:hypothetical protein